MPPSVDPAEAARQLADLDASNAEMARRAVAPWWYHPALGLLVGGMIATMAAPLVWRSAYLVVFFPCLLLLMHAYRRRTGVWVNGWRAGRTRFVSGVLAVSVFLIGLASFGLAQLYDQPFAYLAGGVLTAVVATAAGPLWEVAFRRDLAQGERP